MNDERVLLGRVRTDDFGTSDATAEDAMEPGPATVGAHEPLDQLLERVAAGMWRRWW